MAKIALFGAAGETGKSIAQTLRSQNLSYRVVGRSRESLEKSFGQNPLAEVVTWNPDEPASVKAAADGVSTIIYLVGVPYNQFQLHPELMKKTLDGAVAAGVQNMLLIGTVYSYGRPRTNPVKEDHPREPHTFKGRMRKLQEDLLMDAHAKGLIRGTVLRLPDFYGPRVERSFLYDLFEAAAAGRRAKMVGPIDTPHEFVYTPDVGPIVVSLAQEPRSYGRFWHFAGAGVITQREIAERAFALAGRKPSLLVAGKTMLRLAGLFDPLMRELVEMHYLQTTPVLMDDSALRTLLRNVHKTPYETGIRNSFEAAKNSKPAA
jgi:nucleoside-diphosphate-sugar epimerase